MTTQQILAQRVLVSSDQFQKHILRIAAAALAAETLSASIVAPPWTTPIEPAKSMGRYFHSRGFDMIRCTSLRHGEVLVSVDRNEEALARLFRLVVPVYDQIGREIGRSAARAANSAERADIMRSYQRGDRVPQAWLPLVLKHARAELDLPTHVKLRPPVLKVMSNGWWAGFLEQCARAFRA